VSERRQQAHLAAAGLAQTQRYGEAEVVEPDASGTLRQPRGELVGEPIERRSARSRTPGLGEGCDHVNPVPLSVVSAGSAPVDLPVPARPRVDPADVALPAGYRSEVVLVGLSMPCGMGFADDGTLYVLEGGSTWPTRPHLPGRILRLDPEGRRLDVVAEEGLGGPRHVLVHEGALLVSCKGGHESRIDRIDPAAGRIETLVDGLPDGGWHEPGGPVLGPDGMLYFGQGSVSQQGVILPHGFQVDLARHQRAHDVPGEDVVLTGNKRADRRPDGAVPVPGRDGPVSAVRHVDHRRAGRAWGAEVQLGNPAGVPGRERDGAARVGRAQPLRDDVRRGR
jgi:hypothetical protein